jgi:hypothetical protein
MFHLIIIVLDISESPELPSFDEPVATADDGQSHDDMNEDASLLISTISSDTDSDNSGSICKLAIPCMQERETGLRGIL